MSCSAPRWLSDVFEAHCVREGSGRAIQSHRALRSACLEALGFTLSSSQYTLFFGNGGEQKGGRGSDEEGSSRDKGFYVRIAM